MATYTVNQPGSSVATFPASLKRGDVMNIYNTSTGRIGTKLQWTVPYDGIYTMESRGAKGGGSDGGNGAVMKGDFELKANQVLTLLVGQQGSVGKAIYDEGGGGGGTFIVRESVPLLIAGGGGGAGQYGGPVYPGYGGETSRLGSTVPGGLGLRGEGEGGYGGRSGSDGHGGGGLNNSGFSKDYGSGGAGFWSTANGGTEYANRGGVGGFGCGGGSGFTSGGGGGGYSGGNGGSSTTPAAGGGSYNIGKNQSNSAGTNTGQGFITITFIGSANEPPTTPLLIKQPISKSMNLSNEIIPLEWTASTDPEGNAITYEIDFYNGSTWINIASKIIGTNHICVLPSCDTDKAQFRIRAIDDESNASQYTMSNVFTVAKQVYIVKDGEINKSYKDGAWQLL
ncbi:hypothetical protein [Bacillus cereus]